MERFDVILLGIQDERTRGHTVSQLKSLFRMDEQMVVLMLATAPTTVKREVDSDEAERYFYALTSIGIKVELRRCGKAPATVLGHAGTPNAPATAATVAAAVKTTQRLIKPDADSSEVELPDSFWASIPHAVTMPLRGRGWKWVATCTVFGLLYVALVALWAFALLTSAKHASMVMIFPIAMVSFASVVFMGVLYNYFRVCLWSVLSSEGEPQRIPEIGPSFVAQDILMNGGALFGYLVAMQLFWLVWAYRLSVAGVELSTIVFTPIIAALVVFSALYWPMGVALCAVNNAPTTFWNLGKGVKLMMHAPAAYGTAFAVSIVTWVGPWIALGAIAAFTKPIFAVLAACVLGPLLAYSYGLQGALLGHLFRLQPSQFADEA